MKVFVLGDILSVTTGRNVSRSGMKGVVAVMCYMVSDDGITPIAMAMMREAAASSILGQHPQLSGVIDPPTSGSDFEIESWLQDMEATYGRTLAISSFEEMRHSAA